MQELAAQHLHVDRPVPARSAYDGCSTPPRRGDALPLRGARGLVEIARIAGVDEREARDALAELELLGTAERRETPDGSAPQWALQRRE